MRVAAVIPEGIINALYRALIPMQALAHRGHTVFIEERNEVARPRDLLDYDVVQFVRFWHAEMLAVARQLKRAGVAVVWDNDDDLTAIPRGNPGYRRLGGVRGQQTFSMMTSMMRTADVVTTTSDVLAERYHRASRAEVRVLENFLPPTFARPARVTPHAGVTVGWLAALEHHVDYEQLRLRPAFEELLRRHQELELITVGLDLGLRSERYRHIPITLYGRLPDVLCHFDIGIAPLLDIPFNRARSNIKLKEYAAMGVPWLASPVGPYAQLGEEQGGRLVPDDRWVEEIDRLVRDHETRRRLALRARAWAREQTIERHVGAWEATYAEAVERARAAAA